MQWCREYEFGFVDSVDSLWNKTMTQLLINKNKRERDRKYNERKVFKIWKLGLVRVHQTKA